MESMPESNWGDFLRQWPLRAGGWHKSVKGITEDATATDPKSCMLASR